MGVKDSLQLNYFGASGWGSSRGILIALETTSYSVGISFGTFLKPVGITLPRCISKPVGIYT